MKAKEFISWWMHRRFHINTFETIPCENTFIFFLTLSIYVCKVTFILKQKLLTSNTILKYALFLKPIYTALLFFFDLLTWFILFLLNANRVPYMASHFIHNSLAIKLLQPSLLSIGSDSSCCPIAKQLEGNFRTGFFKSYFTIQMKALYSMGLSAAGNNSSNLFPGMTN